MKITEIFASQNFEGKSTGQTTVFIRCLRCSLKQRCSWCDVRGYPSKEMSINTIVKEVKKYKNINHVTFTGGDFNCQQKEMLQIIGKLPGYRFDIETNGVLTVNPKLFQYVACSPKKQQIVRENLLFYKKFDNVFFKFVIENRESYKMWSGVIKNLRLPKDRVYMMPEGVSPEKVKNNTIQLSKWCVEDGYNVSTRVQILLYGKRMGV